MSIRLPTILSKRMKQFWCEFFGTHEWRMADGVYEEDEKYKYVIAYCKRCGLKGYRKIEK